MYEQFYGLSRTPFAVTPDPQMLFMSRVHREALATIIYGVETRKGFIVCTGEVGTGKSTIIRAFFDQAAADAVKLIYIFTPQVSPFEMARFICHELGLDDPESVFAAVPRLQLKLLDEFEHGRTVVLMIDEAQLLPPETLEFLRLLSNFETDTEKLIQIVLVGQPEVDTMLARRDMRQVNQRVALRARLGPFGVEESFDYIEHRLRLSGAGDLAQVMSQSAAWLIAEAAGGIPRRINILADNALIAGFGMAQRPLGSQLAGAAVRDFLAKSGAATPPPPTLPFAAGWRAARKLRNAIAREKGEPADFVAAPPAPSGRAAARHPAPPMLRPTRPPPAASSAAADGKSNGWSTAAFEAPAPAEPPKAAAESGRLVEPDAAGEPVSLPDIAVIAPVAEPAVEWVAFAEERREPATAPVPAAASRAPPSPQAPTAVVAAPRSVSTPPLPAPHPAGATAEWPALSRIREGLQLPPRPPA
ncbi:MAG: ExeA family protein [Thiohalocapsa sp.]